ncbi:hypothetical protein [Streptomyces sp. NPDC045369]|uniref:hypothetical protein n=1 Tax=Streptomyces sp. NPDC045369 TaxID=3155732 RepID=UPI0033F7F39D
MGEIAVVMPRSRPSSELPLQTNPKWAAASTIMPLVVDVGARACDLACGCHSDSASSARAARRRFRGVVNVPAR